MVGSAYKSELFKQLWDALAILRAVAVQNAQSPAAGEYRRAVERTKEVLAEIGRKGEWGAIPWLVDLLVSPDSEVCSAAASVISDLAGLIPSTSLPAVERQLHAATNLAFHWQMAGFRTQIWTATNEAVHGRGFRGDELLRREWPLPIWAILTMHPSGYVREAALRRLVLSTQLAVALPYVLVRMNDWVPQVQTIAVAAAKKWCVPELADAWVSMRGLVLQLRERSRVDNAWLTDALAEIFLRPEVRRELIDAVGSGDIRVARWAFDVAMSLPDAERGAVVELGFQSVDDLLRMRAACTVRTWPGCPGRERLLMMMAADRLMPIRREALYATLDGPAEVRRVALCNALLDRHASMRSAGRFYLGERSVREEDRVDVRGFYLRVLSQGEPAGRATAILGLGECGVRDDADMLARIVAESRWSVAAAAVRAVAMLDGAQRVNWFIELLGDVRLSVASEAGRALAAMPGAVPAEPLRELLRGAASVHARRYALRVLLQRHPFDAVTDAITAAGSGEALLVRPGTELIERARAWRISHGPTAAQVDAAQRALDALPRRLPDPVLQRLREFIGVRVG